MSNRRKRQSAPAVRSLDSDPLLILTQCGAELLSKPGVEEMISLRLRGVDAPGGDEAGATYVMFPAEARVLIAQLQQALPT